MIDTKTTPIPADLIGTMRGDALIAQYAELAKELYAAEGKHVSRIEVAADHLNGVSVATITYDGDEESAVTGDIPLDVGPPPVLTDDETKLPAGDGEPEGDE